MRVVVTVTGKDKVGIIAAICTLLAAHNVNVLDISQTILQRIFTMNMLVDIASADVSFSELAALLEKEGSRLALSIRAQREDIFDAIHKI